MTVTSGSLPIRSREPSVAPSAAPSPTIIKNRRKRYLELHPSYFNASLELADPLLYDRLVRRFQSAAEREAEGRKKGYSGVLEADLFRAEAKMDAIAHPDAGASWSYSRGPNGEVLAEERDEVPRSKQEGWERWRDEMERRFVRGRDEDFDYTTIDGNEDYDDREEENRVALEKYLGNEEPEWILKDGQRPAGETGVQDF